jgi:hypothetical protein
VVKIETESGRSIRHWGGVGVVYSVIVSIQDLFQVKAGVIDEVRFLWYVLKFLKRNAIRWDVSCECSDCVPKSAVEVCWVDWFVVFLLRLVTDV